MDVGQGDRCVWEDHLWLGAGVARSSGPKNMREGFRYSLGHRHGGWGGWVAIHVWAGCCVPTGGCWRQRAGPTRPATSFGWVPIAGAPRVPRCCALRKWLRVQSPFSPRGRPYEVGPAGGSRAPPPFHLLFPALPLSSVYSLLHAEASSMAELECRPLASQLLGFWDV